MKKLLILIIALAIILVGCASNSSFGIPGITPRAHIEVTSSHADKDWNLSLGVYHDVTYTLTNTGDADGTAFVEISGDYSGTLLQQQVVVPAGSSVTRTARVDSNERDNDIYVKIAGVS
jgi:hypothetical protein